jgi:oligopeptide transport system ATP-binding protein
MTDGPAAEDRVVDVVDLRKVFQPASFRRGRREPVVAVAGVSFAVAAGESLAIVGESGSGKTTIARMLVGLETPTSGAIRILDRERRAGRLSASERRRRSREIQIVFQDPYSSLDPRQRVAACIAEVVKLHFPDLGRGAREERVAHALARVGLSPRIGESYPRGMSGGQRQRVAIARALAAEPRILVLDESVASLDVSIQAQILNLLADIREAGGLSYILISHDLAVVRQVTDHAIVMHRGEVVERGPTDQILDRPSDPYTRRLLAAVPRPGWKPRASLSTPAQEGASE